MLILLNKVSDLLDLTEKSSTEWNLSGDEEEEEEEDIDKEMAALGSNSSSDHGHQLSMK